jgi:hypothetical protein
MYCDVQDLESYFLNRSFKCGDYLTNGKASAFILADTAIINASLRNKYTLPITSQDDLLLLKTINEWMVVGTIDDIFREKNDDGSFERGRNTRKTALDMLKDIREGKILLNSTSITSIIKFNNVNSDGDVVEHRFKESEIGNE